MKEKGQLIKDRGDKHTVFSENDPSLEFDTNGRTHIFQFIKKSGTYSTTTFSIEHSINNGEDFCYADNAEEVILEGDEGIFIVEDLVTDVMKFNFISSDGNPVFEIYYRGVRSGYN